MRSSNVVFVVIAAVSLAGCGSNDDGPKGNPPEVENHDGSPIVVDSGILADSQASDQASESAIGPGVIPILPVDASALDGGGVDSEPVDAAHDVLLGTGLPCRSDSDCCILIDSCSASANLYSQAPGAPPAPSIPRPPMCIPCVPPAIQVQCVQSQCIGVKVEAVTSPLTTSHCGTVDIPDGGFYVLHGGTGAIPPRTSWGCGSP